MSSTRTTHDPFTFWSDQFSKSVKRSWNFSRHTLGIGKAKVGQSPRDEIWRNGKSALYRYQSDQVTQRPPVLLVMSLVSRGYILDLQPGNSFVEHLLGEGFDVFTLDWGVPDAEDANNTLEHYVDDMIPAAVGTIDQMTGGRGVSVFGYCFGGVLSLLYAARHTDDPVRNLMVMATPVDFEKMPEAMKGVGRNGIEPESILDHTGNVPASAVRASFTMLTPTADFATVLDFFEHLGDDKFLESYQAMTQWTRNHIPFPGEAFLQTADLLQDRNGFMTGEIVLGGDRVDLSAISVPFANVVAEKDHIVPQKAALPAIDLVGSADKTEILLPAGHVGLIVGNNGRTRCMPAMSKWLAEHSTPTAD